MEIVLPSDKIPHKVTEIHVIELVIEEKPQIVLEFGHLNYLFLTSDCYSAVVLDLCIGII